MIRLRRDACVALTLSALLSLGCGDSPSSAGQAGADDTEDGDGPATADGTGNVRSDGGSTARAGSLDAGKPADSGVPKQSLTDAALHTPSATDSGTLPADARAPEPADASTRPDAGNAPQAAKKFVGNITTRSQVRSDFAMFWDQITPENEGKWGSVEATRNQMNWAALDRIHDYANQHGVIFKQHNFVWGSQQPGWLAGLSASEQRAEVEEWIRLFCERYPDVALIDVVNEPPPHTSPVYMQALGGAGASGYDWIVQTFKWARQYCPKAVLILNDYNNLEYGNDATHFIDIAKKVKAAGAPIDAVGAQSHDVYKMSADALKKALDQMSSQTGLPIYITEYDINESDDAKQAEIMKSQIPVFWDHAAVKGITLWGYVSGATWEANTGLMSDSGQQRPAMKWLLEFLKR